MVSKLIGVALVTLLFAGAAALDASAQTSGTQPSQQAAPAQPSPPAAAAQPSPPAAADQTKPAAKTHAAAKHKPRHVVEEEPAKEEQAPVAGMAYPPCSKTVKDQCIQLWQRNLSSAYPQCAKIKGSAARAACIEDAYKQTKG